jgi:hypothetical protein
MSRCKEHNFELRRWLVPVIYKNTIWHYENSHEEEGAYFSNMLVFIAAIMQNFCRDAPDIQPAG